MATTVQRNWVEKGKLSRQFQGPGMAKGQAGKHPLKLQTESKPRGDLQVTKSGYSAMAGALVSPKGSRAPLPCDSAEQSGHCISPDIDGRRRHGRATQEPLLRLGSQDTSTSLPESLEIMYFLRADSNLQILTPGLMKTLWSCIHSG